ncbi:MAG: hypothetical protein EA383_07365 [Spirochaetaceae bacterium]|nr:MAG: hypothetical protein EA383_07365 [Spirochaetaceae bacterium]
MIPTRIAQKFVDRFCATIRYNVNVMDTDGIIIAARDSHRIGMYHEVAHTLVIENREVAVVSSEDRPPPGVAPGVNLPVRHRGEVIGVVGLTGPFQDVGEVAHTVRTAIEAMLEYEWEREQLEHRQDRKKILVDALLYQDGVDVEQLRDLMHRCGYDADTPRMPLVFELPDGCTPVEYLKLVKSSRCHTRNDLSFIGSSGHVTVFKAVQTSQSAILGSIRCCFRDYCDAVDERVDEAGMPPFLRCASGPVQELPIRYRISLRTALWTLHSSTERRALFTDHTHELFLHSIAPELWHSVFDAMLARMQASPLVDETTLEQLGRTFMVLREENMSPTRAAERLGIHKNTVVFRMNRLCELSGLDPVANWREREMLYLLFGHMIRQNTPLEKQPSFAAPAIGRSAQNYRV